MYIRALGLDEASIGVDIYILNESVCMMSMILEYSGWESSIIINLSILDEAQRVHYMPYDRM